MLLLLLLLLCKSNRRALRCEEYTVHSDDHVQSCSDQLCLYTESVNGVDDDHTVQTLTGAVAV